MFTFHNDKALDGMNRFSRPAIAEGFEFGLFVLDSGMPHRYLVRDRSRRHRRFRGRRPG